jgi:hypothetical protein
VIFDLQSDLAETKTVQAENAARAAKLKKVLVDGRDAGYTRLGAGG